MFFNGVHGKWCKLNFGTLLMTLNKSAIFTLIQKDNQSINQSIFIFPEKAGLYKTKL